MRLYEYFSTTVNNFETLYLWNETWFSSRLKKVAVITLYYFNVWFTIKIFWKVTSPFHGLPTKSGHLALLYTLGQNHTFYPKNHLYLIFEIMWILWKMRFSRCYFCEKWDFQDKIFVKNEIFQNAIFVKNWLLKCDFLWKMRFWKCDFSGSDFCQK